MADLGITAFTSEWIRSYNGSWGEATHSSSESQWSIGCWGMELAINLVATYNVPICIINGATGGSPIWCHQPNPLGHHQGLDGQWLYTLYANLLNRVEAAKLTHGIRGVLWHQGENDSGTNAPTGDYNYKSYQQDFVDLAAAWKQDFPNIQHYYMFQVWPRPCGMGPKGDQLREAQRTMPRLFSNLSIMSTIGMSGYEGCHYNATGYQQIADSIAPLVKRDNYGLVPTTVITPPNLLRAYFTSSAQTAIALEFDQDMAWNSAATTNIYLDKVGSVVTSGSASGNIITLQLAAASTAQSIDYLEDAYWNGSLTSLLHGSNGISALTFADVAIEATPSSDPFTAWITGSGFTFAAGADKSATGDPDHDGMGNFDEFAFGLDPASGASANPIHSNLSGTQFSYTKRATSGLTYTVEYSTNLSAWNPATYTEAIGSADSNGVQIVTVTVTNPPAGGKLFVRVQAQ